MFDALPFVGGADGDRSTDDGTDAPSDPGSDDGPLDDPAAGHQSVVAPDDVQREPRALATGDTWRQTQWIAEFPDAPVDGCFEKLYSTPETRSTDVSIHVDPRDTCATLDSLENQIEELQADLEYFDEKRRAGARGIEKDLQDHRELYDVLRNTAMKAFDVSMYLSTREADRESLAATTVGNTARRAPANLTPVTPRWAQLDATVAASPVGVDRLNHQLDTTTPMLGAAIGAMFPFVSGALAEPGIEYGTYAINDSPLILDRFERETGYCTMVIGNLGAGKSFSSKLQLVRRAMYDQDTMLVMLDPLQGFAGVNDALDGERVTVGGSRGFNPLEIQPTPQDVLESVPDLDPWAEQIAWVLTFFEAFFDQVASSPLGDRKQTLRRAIQETYEREGITQDPATHDQPSPTISDLVAVLEDVLDDPEAFGYATAGEAERVQSDAQSLLIDLRPSFREGGDLENLARPTEFDLDSDVIYLDLHQEEGTRGRTETSLTMQVLFNAVYERAKQTDKRVVFAIDEAHYLMNDATSLDFSRPPCATVATTTSRCSSSPRPAASSR